MSFRTILVLLALAAFPWMHVAHAAQSLDACTGTITVLPATISTPGTWCMTQKLTTSITSGDAITVATDGVTIDCNDFELQDTPATATTAIAIHALQRKRTTVRHCYVYGFSLGVATTASANGYDLIEDNTFDHETCIGIDLRGDQATVRRNRILNTGGTPSALCDPAGIVVAGIADVVDNVVTGVTSVAGSGQVRGIELSQNATLFSGNVQHNQVVGLIEWSGGSQPSETAIEIDDGTRVSVRDNALWLRSTGGTGVLCFNSAGPVRVKDNSIRNFTTALSGCGDAGGNDSGP